MPIKVAIVTYVTYTDGCSAQDACASKNQVVFISFDVFRWCKYEKAFDTDVLFAGTSFLHLFIATREIDSCYANLPQAGALREIFPCTPCSRHAAVACSWHRLLINDYIQSVTID